MGVKKRGGYRYKNVAISGLPGAGSTTLLVELEKKLGPEGWQTYSGGAFMREYAIKIGKFKGDSKHHHAATDYEDEFDRKVDYEVRRRLAEESNLVVESWLAGFLAQGSEGTLKVLLHCNKALRIDRVVNRDEITVEEAKAHVLKREADNITKWKRMYAKEWQEWVVEPRPEFKDREIDFWHPELFDLGIDTYKHSKEEVLSIVLDRLGYFQRAL